MASQRHSRTLSQLRSGIAVALKDLVSVTKWHRRGTQGPCLSYEVASQSHSRTLSQLLSGVGDCIYVEARFWKANPKSSTNFPDNIFDRLLCLFSDESHYLTRRYLYSKTVNDWFGKNGLFISIHATTKRMLQTLEHWVSVNQYPCTLYKCLVLFVHYKRKRMKCKYSRMK